ncbi:MAG: hypothetical protein SGBAC_009444 [Bacillariaceae sp.]
MTKPNSSEEAHQQDVNKDVENGTTVSAEKVAVLKGQRTVTWRLIRWPLALTIVVGIAATLLLLDNGGSHNISQLTNSNSTAMTNDSNTFETNDSGTPQPTNSITVEPTDHIMTFEPTDRPTDRPTLPPTTFISTFLQTSDITTGSYQWRDWNAKGCLEYETTDEAHEKLHNLSLYNGCDPVTLVVRTDCMCADGVKFSTESGEEIPTPTMYSRTGAGITGVCILKPSDPVPVAECTQYATVGDAYADGAVAVGDWNGEQDELVVSAGCRCKPNRYSGPPYHKVHYELPSWDFHPATGDSSIATIEASANTPALACVHEKA